MNRVFKHGRPQNVYDIHPSGGQPTAADVHRAYDDSLGFLEPRARETQKSASYWRAYADGARDRYLMFWVGFVVGALATAVVRAIAN